MNIFQYLDYYIKNHGTTYGSIEDKNECISQMLSRDEQQIYEYIKKSDKERLIKFN